MRSKWSAPLVAAAAALVAASCTSADAPGSGHEPIGAGRWPLRQVGTVELTGGPVRFDYTSLDVERGLLFVAHMGADAVIEVDVRDHRVVRTIGGLPDVHGVLVVPERHRVYATATGRNQVMSIDEDSGAVVHASPTDDYPDGLAYDPLRAAVWTTNEHAGTETVIDADTGDVRGRVELGGEVGNVVYDPVTDRMVVAVQGRADLAIIDPATLAVTDRIPVPGCEAPHGQTLGITDRLMFVGCAASATQVTVDLTTRTVTDRTEVGATPDVLAYDQTAHRLYLAAESGWVSIFDQRAGHTTVVGARHLADGAHSLALDPNTHHSFFPIPRGPNDRPALLEFEPTAATP